MMFRPGMYGPQGFWVRGSIDLGAQIIITAKNKTKVNYTWIQIYLPGIY